MKRLLALCIALSLFACKKEEPKDYATISGKIENSHESKTLKIFKGREYEKVITIADDGTFKDTLKIVEGDYSIQHGEQYGVMYLKNDNESTLNTDYESFDKSLVFGGDGSDINNFSLQSFLISSDYFTEELVSNGSQEDLDTAINKYNSAYEELKKKYVDVDSIHIAQMDKNVEGQAKQLKQYMASKIAMRAQFPEGKASPTFVNYENFAGGNTSLSDLKGKYVYMDIWATWCGPCKAEIPSLKKVEKQFHGKNIEFVSISVDEGRGYKGDAAKAYEGWKKMITEKELGGMQLLADNGFRSTFIQDYKINGIPRFILVDPEGNIINADAPRPSNPQLVELFNTLKL
ncbi:TlpA disulfide reductase family protein [Winogradskyella sp.]|uniref:TlpA family protein disulfide reductase n=1 Tax=Winogradskyella sp. TaxID=1883156 RepID=UPI0025FD2610|nr:TlpA disulfide reductase family protein [Winogradskyella sp.]